MNVDASTDGSHFRNVDVVADLLLEKLPFECSTSHAHNLNGINDVNCSDLANAP